MILCSEQFLIILSLLTHSRAVLDVSWWSSVAQLSASNLAVNDDDSSSASICQKLQGLSPGQAKHCEVFVDHMPAVGQGAKQAIEECEYQFRNQRWNCSTPPDSGLIGPVHKLGTREAAFTYAILSAGVTHEIGRRCKLGLLKSCGCLDNSKIPKGTKPSDVGVNEDWTWGGCGDNIFYGSRFSRNFIDVRDKEEKMKRSESHGKALMNLWNNDVGRKVLRRNTKPKCKCHGVSGSCNMKTCWMQLPSMRDIGSSLEQKYRSARRIVINARGNMQFESPRNKRAVLDLVFLDNSPDYCREDMKQGTMGTTGRVCKRDPSAANNCDLLCCGRGYDSYMEEVTYKCKCKFQWCCEVVCQQCQNLTQIHVCKS